MLPRIYIFVLFGVFIGADRARSDDAKQPAFAIEYLAIKKDLDAKWEKVSAPLWKEHEEAKNEKDREATMKRIADESNKIHRPATAKVMSIVRPHAADPAAVDTLVWVAQGSSPDYCNEAAELLRKHHLTNKQTLKLAYWSKSAPMKWTEPLLCDQLNATDLPIAEKPRILLALAMVKHTQSKWLSDMAASTDKSDLLKMESLFGKVFIDDLRKMDVSKTEAVAIQLFTELIEKHGTEKLIDGLTFGKVAKSAIFEMQNLSIGKTAPDIVGEDTDGVKFKLSDYRGKVVVLSFWATWCGPCMAQIPHEREIVNRLKDKPFVIIGVNSDEDKKPLKAVMEKEKIAWRSFWCGEKGPMSDLPSAWNVTGWPTMYVLDHKGIIRGKQVYGQSLDRVVDKWIAVAERGE